MIHWNTMQQRDRARVPGQQMQYARPRRGLFWNKKYDLGAPVQLIQGDRYQSRWLVALPQPTVNQPASSCGDVLNTVKSAIQQAGFVQGFPWTNLVAGGVTPPISQIPSGWPAGLATLPFGTPGACLILLDGIWGAPTTTIDSSQFPALPGMVPWDLWNAASPQQKLIEGPKPPGPCDPSQLTFDIAAGIFKCAGQVLQPPLKVPPINIPTTDEKKEEKKSVLPWVIGGGVVLVGGFLLLR